MKTSSGRAWREAAMEGIASTSAARPDHDRRRSRNYAAEAHRLCFAQGIFYIVTGVWPLIQPTTFELATGAKRDLWLAQTVGALLAVSGIALISAARAGRITREIAIIAVGAALVLGIADVSSFWQPRASLSYFGDAVVEFFFVAVWAIKLWSHRLAEANQP